MSGFVETEELERLLHLFVKVVMMKVSFNAQRDQTNKDGLWILEENSCLTICHAHR